MPAQTTFDGTPATTAQTRRSLDATSKAASPPFDPPKIAIRRGLPPGWLASQSSPLVKVSSGTACRVFGTPSVPK